MLKNTPFESKNYVLSFNIKASTHFLTKKNWVSFRKRFWPIWNTYGWFFSETFGWCHHDDDDENNGSCYCAHACMYYVYRHIDDVICVQGANYNWNDLANIILELKGVFSRFPFLSNVVSQSISVCFFQSELDVIMETSENHFRSCFTPWLH